ncbi:dihydrolipoamide acetyltransferase family protein [Algivirga pacifica]|uniref:Dihydrolipoamide acetyltransferase component of pyruvate dehydrogenase complex n=1 Tax=Algivirga pacifica TaxID=1162670 RepID=A0ABP9DJM4_9BACT
MALVKMVLPAMGESVFEATVLTWLKNVGDRIETDESVLEVATDKVDTDVPASHSGILKEILVQEGEVAQVGHPIAVIETEGGSTETEEDTTPEKQTEEVIETPAETPVQESHTATTVSSNRFYSPLVKSIAQKENISGEELDQIPGSGKEGRVTKDDILAYVKNRTTTAAAPTPKAAPAPASTPQPQGSTTEQPATKQVAPAVSVDGEDEIIQMDRMRKMIADRMVQSKHTAPHVTSCVEADMTNVVNWRNQWKNKFKEREGDSLTFMPIIVQAIARAIKDFPMINVQVDGDKIIRKKSVNIGIAVALPSGNLIVPVVKNADRLSLSGLALAINDLARRARENKLKPDELQGGTYTISNIGSFGNTIGTPIINQPQVAIMAIGTIKKKPAVIETPQGDLIGIRHMSYFSHSYDHRVVDGALGGMFVRRVCDYLENWDVNQGI